MVIYLNKVVIETDIHLWEETVQEFVHPWG
jgi:hypothetical protein